MRNSGFDLHQQLWDNFTFSEKRSIFIGMLGNYSINKVNYLWWILIFVIFFLVYIYIGSINRPLRNAESKYAEIPREMLVTGDWITPHLNYVNYYTKPPLTFWITAFAYKIFGIHPWVARITNISWAFIASLLTGILAANMFDSFAGPITNAIFLLTAEVYAYCLDAGIEFSVISCNIAALLFFWLYDNSYYKKKLYLRLFYTCVGLSFLAKGILGLILPLVIVFVYLISFRELQKAKYVFDFIGIFILLIFTIPWSAVMTLRHPDFLKCFVINEHIGRLLGTLDSKDSLFPTSIFLAYVIGEFFPWIIFTPFIWDVIVKFWKNHQYKKKIIFLIIWSLIPLLLFSIARCKVDFYSLHIYPPLFIILSIGIEKMITTKKETKIIRWWKYLWLYLAIIAIIAYFILTLKSKSNLISMLDIPSIKLAKQFLLTSFLFNSLMFFLIFKNKIKGFFLLLFCYMIIFFFFTKEMYVAAYNNDSIKFAADAYNKYSSNKTNSLLFSEELPEFAHIAILNFYTKKPAYFLRNNKNSKLHFIQKDRMKMCFDEDDFFKLVKKGIKIYFIGHIKRTKERFNRMGIKYNIIAKNGNKAIFEIN